MTSSIISGNFVSGKYADGGGIYLFYTKLMLTSSTVFGNFVSGEHANGGGIYAFYSKVELTNATVAGNSAENGGGIYELSDSQTTLRNSIVTKNHASNGAADDADIYGNWTGGTQYNIVGDDPDFVYAPQFDDAEGKPINVDAWNLRLKETSKAIDVGNNADVVGEYDCDGNARVLFGKKTTLKPTVDLGAYEFEFVDPSRKTFTVDSLGCGAGSDVDGERTLRWAIDQASLDVWKDYVVLIMFADYLIGTGAIYLGATGELSISRSLTIDAEGVMIDANGNSRIFNVAPGTTVTIYGGTFTNGKSGSTETPENGDAIYNAGTLTLNGANFQANTATKNGDAIYNAGTLTLNDANFQANMATKNGGAIAVWEISWGDGTTNRFERLSNSLTAAHYYAQDGFFDVSLKATYLDGTCTTFESFATRKVGDDAKFKAVDDVFATSDDLFDELELGPFLR